jgi:hypothetical protein
VLDRISGNAERIANDLTIRELVPCFSPATRDVVRHREWILARRIRQEHDPKGFVPLGDVELDEATQLRDHFTGGPSKVIGGDSGAEEDEAGESVARFVQQQIQQQGVRVRSQRLEAAKLLVPPNAGLSVGILAGSHVLLVDHARSVRYEWQVPQLPGKEGFRPEGASRN